MWSREASFPARARRAVPIRRGLDRPRARHRPYTPADAPPDRPGLARPGRRRVLLTACAAGAAGADRTDARGSCSGRRPRSTRPRPATPAARRSSRSSSRSLTDLRRRPRAPAGPGRVLAHRRGRPAVVFQLRAGPDVLRRHARCGPSDVVRSWLRLIDPAAPSPLATLMLDVDGRRASTLAGRPARDDVGLTADDDDRHGHRRPRPPGRRLPDRRRQPDVRRRPAGRRRRRRRAPRRATASSASGGYRLTDRDSRSMLTLRPTSATGRDRRRIDDHRGRHRPRWPERGRGVRGRRPRLHAHRRASMPTGSPTTRPSARSSARSPRCRSTTTASTPAARRSTTCASARRSRGRRLAAHRRLLAVPTARRRRDVDGPAGHPGPERARRRPASTTPTRPARCSPRPASRAARASRSHAC